MWLCETKPRLFVNSGGWRLWHNTGKCTITVIKYRTVPSEMHLEVPQTPRPLCQQSGIWELQHHQTCWDDPWRHGLSSASPGKKRQCGSQASGSTRAPFPHALRAHPLLHMLQGGVQATKMLERGIADGEGQRVGRSASLPLEKAGTLHRFTTTFRTSRESSEGLGMATLSTFPSGQSLAGQAAPDTYVP